MLEWMRRNNKKLLAVFTVGLMIAFAFTPQWGKNQHDAAFTVGELNGRRVMQPEVQYAGNLWDYLLQNIFFISAQNGNQPIPLGYLLGADAQGGAQLAAQLRENHLMLYVLLDEARRMGVTVSQSEVDDVVKDVGVRIDETGKLYSYDKLINTENGDHVQAAVAQFIMLRKSFMRASSVIKISEPMLDLRQALEMQAVKLSTIEFPAKDFQDKVATPTQQQLDEQFNTYAEMLPEVDPTRNPAGFGYKYPDRIKVQYVEIPIDDLRSLVRKSKSDYDWEVEAQKYYRKNQSEFPTTQPTRQVAKTFDLTSPAPSTAPSTQPTTKPFADVKDDIVAKLVAPEVNKLKETLVNRILSTMGGDNMAYGAILKGTSTTQRTSLNVPYDTFDYLAKLRDDIQKQYKVTIVIQQLANQFYTYPELKEQLTIGKAYIPSQNMNRLTFADYAMLSCEKFAQPGERRREGMLSLYAPSRPLVDDLGNEYIFRVTDAQTSHKPASISEVLEKVTSDWKSAAAMQLAAQAALKAKDIATAQNFEAAAASTGKSVIHTGWLSGDTMWQDPALNLSLESTRGFAQQVVDMLSLAKSAPDKPVISVITLPRDNKVLLARLDNTKPAGPGDQMQFARYMQAAQFEQQMRSRMPADWFNWENIKTRNNFVDKASINKKSES